MSGELTVTGRDWLYLRDKKEMLPAPFRSRIDLGEYSVVGTGHIENPGKVLDKVPIGGALALRCREDAVYVLSENVELGTLPEREGRIFSKLLAAGIKLTAELSDKGIESFFPLISVKITMEEF